MTGSPVPINLQGVCKDAFPHVSYCQRRIVMCNISALYCSGELNPLQLGNQEPLSAFRMLPVHSAS